MTISRYRALGVGLVVGIVIGAGGASVLSAGGDGHGLADEGCVHITTSVTVCGAGAKRVCKSTLLARLDARIGADRATPTGSLQDEECRKVV